MKIMKISTGIPIISCDQVKVATLVIFFTFSEKFPVFYKKVEIPQKIILQKQKKQKIMQKSLFPYLVARAGAPFPDFPQIMVKFTIIHQKVNY